MVFDKKTDDYVARSPLDRDESLVKAPPAYTVGNRMMGPRYDGTKSPLSMPPSDSNDEYWVTRRDGAAIGKGTKNHVYGTYVGGKLREWGIDPDTLSRWPVRKRLKLLKRLKSVVDRELWQTHSDCIEVVKDGSEISGLYDSMANMFTEGKDDDPVLWKDEDGNGIKTDVGMLRRVWSRCSDGHSVGDFVVGKLPDSVVIKLCRRISSALREAEANVEARRALHRRLRQWSKGPLTLERPQGSSLHHFTSYDHVVNDAKAYYDCQIVLVENDWGAAVPPMEGEWRVPFQLMCWEFRLSGVRVLAMTDVDPARSGVTLTVQQNRMYLIYGADDHWCVDGYEYELGCAKLPPGKLYGIQREDTEFRRVAKFCYDTIRATCVMLDAQVARQERVVTSSKLKEQRAREGKSPLRDHYVVRLLHSESRAYNQRARSAGASAGVARAPQRGHWRKGTWVHYDDQDSGQVQYTNDGGFVVSKTWRRWHFAGNPNNIIHKEYRV